MPRHYAALILALVVPGPARAQVADAVLTEPRPLGWWGDTDNTLAPCPSTPPGPFPYLIWENPLPALGRFYFRFDGSVRPQASLSDEGKLFTALGSDHTTGAQLDQMEIPLASGALCPDGWPCVTFPAPYRDIAELGHPDKTICDVYRQGNGPHALPCPSGFSIEVYSQKIRQKPQWTSGNAARAALIALQCNGPQPTQPPGPTKTKTPTPRPGGPAATKTKTPRPSGCCDPMPPNPCPPGLPLCHPPTKTRTPTRTLTAPPATITATRSPSPTLTSTRIPTATRTRTLPPTITATNKPTPTPTGGGCGHGSAAPINALAVAAVGLLIWRNRR